MARIRSIKPTFWTDERLCALSPLVRMTFLGLISAMADDEGRCKGDARLVKAAVWPLDDAITAIVVDEHLCELHDAGRILLYAVAGVRYIQVVHWRRHQRIDKPRASELPPPPDDSPTPPGPFDDDSQNRTRDVDARKGEGKGEGVEKERSGAEAAPPAPLSLRSREEDDDTYAPDTDPLELEQPAPVVPRVVLPSDAEAFLDQFYSLATEKRRLDVAAQLYDALDPAKRGARMGRGLYIRARGADHLAECCREIMADPPRHPDAAIVVLLKKLQDPPKGPPVTEVRAKENREREALEERYHAAARRAGIQWANAHPAEYEPLVAQIDREFARATGGIGKMARDAALTQRCAQAAGFPSFDEWTAGGAVAEVPA